MSSPPNSPHSPMRRSEHRSGSTSPTHRRPRSNSHRSAVPPGFLSHKPKQTPISEMSVWELQNKFSRNAKILASRWVSLCSICRGILLLTITPLLLSFTYSLLQRVYIYIYIICIIHPSNATSSSYVQRITAEQAAIQEQLVEVHGMEVINTGLKNTRITGDDDSESMIGIDDVEMKPEPAHPMKNAIDAKKRAIARFVSFFCSSLSILYLALPRIKYFN